MNQDVTAIQNLITERIKNHNIKELVVDQLAKKEVDLRAAMVLEALEVAKRLDGELKKLENQTESRFETQIVDGQEKTVEIRSRSKQTMDAITKQKEKMGKFDSAFAEALNDGKFDNLKKQLQSAKSGGGQDSA
jgi:hypothetical protein